ncbi:hypothetical protein NQ317_018018 [Molorchus minor]|uniref:Uncharacterized protein n=1 Tax=Molorchus minor TaxID=1323400 RepID=A0ABQ9JS04_9CUCU|nr:hypothetical protein NQ317_018018 [Molorchus minor]
MLYIRSLSRWTFMDFQTHQLKLMELVSVDTFHFDKFGSLNRLKRSIAYCFRFRRLFKPNEPQFNSIYFYPFDHNTMK